MDFDSRDFRDLPWDRIVPMAERYRELASRPGDGIGSGLERADRLSVLADGSQGLANPRAVQEPHQ